MGMFRRLFHRFALLFPLVAIAFCFQNFSELEVPAIPEIQQDNYGTTATSVEGAAEQFVRSQWMPELRHLETRWSENLQLRFNPSSVSSGEVEMNLMGSTLRSPTSSDAMKLSVVNDRLRVQFTGINLACDYTPGKDLLSVRTNLHAPGQLQLEHSGKDRASRLSWQMSW